MKKTKENFNEKLTKKIVNTNFKHQLQNLNKKLDQPQILKKELTKRAVTL